MKCDFILKKKCTRLIFGVLLICNVNRQAIAEEDFQYWSRYLICFHSDERFSTAVFSDLRLYNNFSQLGFVLFSPGVKYKLHDCLDLQMNLSYVKLRDIKDDLINHYRIEPEVRPHFTIGSRNVFNLRNRMELRHIENKGWSNMRYRGFLQLTRLFNECGCVISVFANTEFFYDFTLHRHVEQRSIPIGINVSLAESAELQLFYMIQQKRRMDHGFSNQIIGSKITVQL